MKITTNHHTHTHLCKHAEGTVEDYVTAAIEKKLSVIGISDHAPLCPELSFVKTRRMSIEEYDKIYLPDLDKAIQKHGSKIQILKSIEVEYLPPMRAYIERFSKELDYLILGQHLLFDQGTIIDVYETMNEHFIDLYRSTCIEAMSTGMFKIFAHPEIFTWCHRTWDDLCEQVSIDLIEAAIRCDVLLEINANGCRRGSLRTKDGEFTRIYPRLEFWRLVAKTKARVIINDDSHAIAHLNDEATEEAYRFAHHLGIQLSSF